MRFDHARHQHRPAAIDQRRAGAVEPGRRGRDRRDALTLDPHLAGIGLRAGAVEDPDIGEKDRACHGRLPL